MEYSTRYFIPLDKVKDAEIIKSIKINGEGVVVFASQVPGADRGLEDFMALIG